MRWTVFLFPSRVVPENHTMKNDNTHNSKSTRTPPPLTGKALEAARHLLKKYPPLPSMKGLVVVSVTLSRPANRDTGKSHA